MEGKITEGLLFKCGGVPFFSKSKYYSRPEDEARILAQMKNIAETPDDGCLVISGDGGVGKTTTISRLFMDDKNHPFFVNDCNINRAIWVNCFDWREHFDEKAFVDKIVSLAKDLEDSDRSANFNNLQGISSYYRKKNLRVAFILDDMFNYRLIQSFMENQAEPPICYVVTRDAQTIIETNFGMVQKVERLEEMNEDGIKNMLKMTYKLNNFLSEEQLLRLAKLCCGLPLIASLIAARITNCEDRGDVKNEYRNLISPQYKISDLRTQNRSFKTVSNLFTFSLDQMDASMRALYYAFLLFNPAEPVSIFDLGVLWGFDLDEGSRCGLRGVCRAFEKRSLVRRVKKQIAEKDDEAEEANKDEIVLDDSTEDRFLVHQMLYESALEKAKKDFGLRGSDSECLNKVRVKIISGELGSADFETLDESGLSVTLCALKFHRRRLLERIVAKLDANDLANVCLKKSSQTEGMTFLQYLYRYKWQSNRRMPLSLFDYRQAVAFDALSANSSYRIIRKFFARFLECGGPDLLWRVISEPKTDDRYSSLFMDVLNTEQQMHQMIDRIPLLTKVQRWAPIFWETKWEAKLHNPANKTEPLVLAAFRGDFDEVVRLVDGANEKVIGHATRVAARRGHLEMLKFLAERWPDSIKSTNNEGRLPIMLAAQNGNLEVVMYLWEKWLESLTISDSNGRTAILWASKNGKIECVEFLYKKDPDSAKKQDKEGFSTLAVAAAGGHLDVVKFLANENSELLDLRRKELNACALTGAATLGQMEVVKYLYPKYKTEDHVTSLSVAALSGQVDIINYLLEKNPELAKMTDPKLQANHLMLAATYGHLECVEALYGKCDDFMAVMGSKVSALMVASTSGHLDIVKWLYYKDPEGAKLVTSDGDSAFTVAEKMGHREIVQFLKDNM